MGSPQKPTFNKIRVQDLDLNRVQDAVAGALNLILGTPILNYQIVDSMSIGNIGADPILLTTSFKNIPHGLGRTYIGYIVISQDADARIWSETAGNPDTAKFVRLRAAGTNTTVKLLVF